MFASLSHHFPQIRTIPPGGDVTATVANTVVASAMLAVLAPLLALIAFAIRVSSRGPVLFRQQRYGKRGEIFTIYKFRTMRCTESGHEAVQCRKNDPRVTMIGSFLRRTSLDELPQLINVVRGEMAMVGPRPHPLGLDPEFAPRIRDYQRRYAVKPGLTGLAQIRGHRGPTETLEAMSLRIASDLEYVYRRSLGLDLWIMIRTVPAVVLGCNAL